MTAWAAVRCAADKAFSGTVSQHEDPGELRYSSRRVKSITINYFVLQTLAFVAAESLLRQKMSHSITVRASLIMS